MNKYKIVIYFSDKINYETYIDSELNLDDFTADFNMQYTNRTKDWVAFIGTNQKVVVNIHNILFYSIEQVQND